LKKIKSEPKINKDHICDSYIAECDFGIKFEDGSSGIVEEGEVLKVLSITDTKVRFEKIGWVSGHSYIFRFLEGSKPHQYSIEEYLQGINEKEEKVIE